MMVLRMGPAWPEPLPRPYRLNPRDGIGAEDRKPPAVELNLNP
jgi:hypothetical protein